MQLLSSKLAIDFLSHAAPRPWVRRMLQWMIFDGQLPPYFTAGKIRSLVRAYDFFYEMEGFDHEMKPTQLNRLIRKNYDQDIAAKLVGCNRLDEIEEHVIEWGPDDEPKKLGAGYFVYSDDIDWELGCIKVTVHQPTGVLDEHLFWDAEEHLSSQFENADFEVNLSGLCFEREAIEMLLPSQAMVTLDSTARIPFDRQSSKSTLGRPQKWDWEGAMAHIVSIAQHPDGLPFGDGAQAQIEGMFADWFIGKTGNSPATSQIRQRAQIIMTSVKKD